LTEGQIVSISFFANFFALRQKNRELKIFISYIISLREIELKQKDSKKLD